MQSEVFLLENALEQCVELYLQDSSIDCFWSRALKILFRREYTELERIIVRWRVELLGVFGLEKYLGNRKKHDSTVPVRVTT
jgi:hypothetical protein